MPINLQNQENIATGWPGPPQLHAPEIGSLVSAILRDRLGRQELTQKTIADTIKNIQGQRQEDAYIQAVKEWGLVPQDYEGSAAGASNIAKLIQEQNQQKYMEKYYGDIGGAATTRADAAANWVDAGSEDDSQFYIDPDTGLRMQRTPKGPKLAPQYAQPDVVPQKTAGEDAARADYAAAQQEADVAGAERKRMEQRHGMPSKTGTFPGARPDLFFGGGGPTDPVRQRFIRDKWMEAARTEQEARARAADLAKKYPNITVPQQQARSSGPPPADQNLAPGYGVPAEIAPSRDQAAPGQTYYAPDGSVRVRGN